MYDDSQYVTDLFQTQKRCNLQIGLSVVSPFWSSHGNRLLARWVSRHPVDGHFLKKFFLFSYVAFSSKLLIWAGSIAHFGRLHVLFKFWLKARMEKPLWFKFRHTVVHIQWNPVYMVTNTLQKSGHINGVAILKEFFKWGKILTELLFGPE